MCVVICCVCVMVSLVLLCYLLCGIVYVVLWFVVVCLNLWFFFVDLGDLLLSSLYLFMMVSILVSFYALFAPTASLAYLKFVFVW